MIFNRPKFRGHGRWNMKLNRWSAIVKIVQSFNDRNHPGMALCAVSIFLLAPVAFALVAKLFI